MPLYAFECGVCGAAGEALVLLRDYRPDGLDCPECGGAARRLVTGAHLDGPTDTKPLVVGQINRSFTSKKALDTFLKDRPDVEMHGKNDRSWRDFVDRERSGLETSAKAAGFRDWRHQQGEVNREARRRRDLGG